MKIYQQIASIIKSRSNDRGKRDVWFNKMASLVSLLPSGSGIDYGTKIIIDECKVDRLVLSAAYHHMNENGYYDGWTEHNIIVTPSFDGIDIRVTGRDRNGIKEYLADLYHHALNEVIENKE